MHQLSQIYFWHKILHVSDSFCVNHQEIFTLHTAMTYTIAVCTVKNSWWWTEELSETCRSLFQKVILGKLVLLASFITRMNLQ